MNRRQKISFQGYQIADSASEQVFNQKNVQNGEISTNPIFQVVMLHNPEFIRAIGYFFHHNE